MCNSYQLYHLCQVLLLQHVYIVFDSYKTKIHLRHPRSQPELPGLSKISIDAPALTELKFLPLTVEGALHSNVNENPSVNMNGLQWNDNGSFYPRINGVVSYVRLIGNSCISLDVSYQHHVWGIGCIKNNKYPIYQFQPLGK